ncbi:hypothetical protein D1872_334060 [compost metagenome]
MLVNLVPGLVADTIQNTAMAACRYDGVVGEGLVVVEVNNHLLPKPLSYGYQGVAARGVRWKV